MDLLIGIGVFLAIVLLIEGGYFVFRNLMRPDARKVKRRLQNLSLDGYGNEVTDIERKSVFSEIPWLNRLLVNIRRAHKINRLLEQAGVRRPLGFFGLLTLLLASSGYLGGSLATTNPMAPTLLAAALGAAPLLYIYAKKKRRMEKFQRQLPEALGLTARSLKAGHAFSAGLKMVADEFDDPIGPEFGKTLDEINFGASLSDALKNLATRVDCPDLKFFVISVIIQRETGGNLAEILENIAYLIRERFKLQGHVKALSAEGKLSATILIFLPLVIGLVISLINPGYTEVLFTDPMGKAMVAFAIFMMILGIFVMRRIIEIKV